MIVGIHVGQLKPRLTTSPSSRARPWRYSKEIQQPCRPTPTSSDQPRLASCTSPLCQATGIDPHATRSHRGDQRSPSIPRSLGRPGAGASCHPRACRRGRLAVIERTVPAVRATLCGWMSIGCSCTPSMILSGARPPPMNMKC